MMRFIIMIFGILMLCQCKNQIPGDTSRAGEQIPSINLLMADSSTVLNTRNLPQSSNVVLIFFETDCPYCKAETENILKHINDFKNTQFCFITFSSLQDIRAFAKAHKFEQYKNIHVGQDTAGAYMKSFQLKTVPHTTIFGEDHRLKSIFSSATDAKNIHSVLD